MKGLWLEDRRLSFRRDLPRPDPGPGEALVRVRLAGICGTDLELVKGYYPFRGIPGHEFVGEIAEAPDASDRVGERVVGAINVACTSCQYCRRGVPEHCEDRTVLGILGHNGAFADYLQLPLCNLTRVPDSVGDEAAVFSEPLAAALRILEQVDAISSESVLLIGAGRLGQLIARVLARSGCPLKVFVRRPSQREMLRRHSIDCLEQIPIAQADLVVEATGSAEGFELARKAVRPRGTIVLKSTYHGVASVDFSRLVVDETTLVGSRCGPLPAAVEWLADGRITPADLIADVVEIDQGVEAFRRAAEPGVFKILLKPAE